MVPALLPLAMRSAGERIAERLVTSIALGQFVTGQRLPSERALARLLAVSRSTVRTAIQRLETTGYVSVRRGRNGGTFVTAQWGPESTEMIRRALLPEWGRLEQLLDFRRLVEQQIARTAAERRTGEDRTEILRALHDYKRAGNDREASRTADVAVHDAIAHAAHNAHLTDLSRRLRHDIGLGFPAEPYTAEVRRRALEQHPQLAAAVLGGRPDEAADLADTHFTLSETLLRQLYDRIARPQ